MQDTARPQPAAESPWMPHVIERVQSLRFGSITIKIHEGQVVVVEATELTRFHLPSNKDSEKDARKLKKTPPPKP